jgi:pimeloyl-ACP methyl ester carboxylesterase
MIKAVYDKFGPVQSFIAHSFGGLAVSLFMEEQKYQDNKKLVLIAPATETESALKSFAEFLKIDEEVMEELKKIIQEKSGRMVDQISIRAIAPKIKAEVLWVHDEEDEVTPWADAEKIQQDGHANFQFLVTKGLGHRKIYRDHQVKKAVMEFL